MRKGSAFCFSLGLKDPEKLELVYYRVYKSFIEAVDADDNGVDAVDGGVRKYREIESLPAQIAALFPQWYVSESETKELVEEEIRLTVRLWQREEEASAKLRGLFREGHVAPFNWLTVPISSDSTVDTWNFRKAMRLADAAFARAVADARDGWLQCFAIVKEAFEKRRSVFKSGEVLELPYYCPTDVRTP